MSRAAEKMRDRARASIRAAQELLDAGVFVLGERVALARKGPVESADAWCSSREHLAEAENTLARARFQATRAAWTSAAGLAEVADREVQKALRMLDHTREGT